MATPAATRKDDRCTGHDACPPVPLTEYSPNVFINNRNAGREGDHYVVHGCPAHVPHQDYIAKGSKTVFINSIPAARVDDPVIIAGAVMEGSPDVFIGG